MATNKPVSKNPDNRFCRDCAYPVKDGKCTNPNKKCKNLPLLKRRKCGRCGCPIPNGEQSKPCKNGHMA